MHNCIMFMESPEETLNVLHLLIADYFVFMEVYKTFVTGEIIRYLGLNRKVGKSCKR